jgi:hypothetical protein
MTENGQANGNTGDPDKGASILAVMRRAVHDALLDHKQAGNSVAIWEDGCVKIIPPEEIEISDRSVHDNPIEAALEGS